MAVLPSDPLVNNIPDAYLARSPIHGTGLFASRPMVPGEVICRLTGELLPWKSYLALGKEQYISLEWNALSETLLYVRRNKTKNAAINHSRTNYNIRNRCVGPALNPTSIELFVVKPVDAGEELLLNYLFEPLPEEYRATHGWIYL